MRACRQFSTPCARGRGRSLASISWYVCLAIVLRQPCSVVQGRSFSIHTNSLNIVKKPWRSGRRPQSAVVATAIRAPGSLLHELTGVQVPRLRRRGQQASRATRTSSVEPDTSQSEQENVARPATAIVQLLSSRRSPSPRPPPDAGSAKARTRRVQQPVRPHGGSQAKSVSASVPGPRRAPLSPGKTRSMSVSAAHVRPLLTVVRERRPMAASTWPQQRPIRERPASEPGVRSAAGALYSARAPYWSAREPKAGVSCPPGVRDPAHGTPPGPLLPLRPPGCTSASAPLYVSTTSSRSVTSSVSRPTAVRITHEGELPVPPGSTVESLQPSASSYSEGTENWGEMGRVPSVTRSELSAGQQTVVNVLQQLQEKVSQTGDAKQEAPTYPGEENLSLLHVPQPVAAATGEDEKEAALKAALARLLPQEHLFTVTGINGEQMEARRGAVVRGGPEVIECIVVNVYTSTNYVGKFYYAEATSWPLSVQELRLLYTGAEHRLMKEVAGNQKLLTKAGADQLRSLCLSVYYGEYKLTSRSPSNEEFGDSMVDETYNVGSTRALMVLAKFLLTPVVGPSIEVLWHSDLTEAALKFLVYRLVYTLSQLHNFGLAHRGLNSATVLADNASGLPTLSHFASVAEFHTSESCTYISLRTVPYASPEVALSVAKGESRFAVNEYEDSWALGVLMYMLLCRGKHPWSLNDIAAELGTRMKEEDAIQHFFLSYHTLVTRETFLGKECLRTGTPAPSLMSIIKLLIDPLRESRWTVRYLFANHPFFSVSG